MKLPALRYAPSHTAPFGPYRFPLAFAFEAREAARLWKKRLRSRSRVARDEYRKRYRMLKQKKLCVFCGKRKTQGYVLCEPCRAQAVAGMASRYHGNRVDGACTDCRGIPAAGKSRCDPCAARRKLYPSRNWEYRREKERPGSRVRSQRAGPP